MSAAKRSGVGVQHDLRCSFELTQAYPLFTSHLPSPLILPPLLPRLVLEKAFGRKALKAGAAAGGAHAHGHEEL